MRRQRNKHGKKVMTREEAQVLVNLFNDKLAAIVDKAVYDNLLADVRFEASVYTFRNGDCMCELVTKDKYQDVKAQLTATPLLRAMFSDAELHARIFDVEKENVYVVEISIRYKHPDGGSNGLSNLLGVQIDKDTYEVLVKLNH